jgi:hypothetical protein
VNPAQIQAQMKTATDQSNALYGQDVANSNQAQGQYQNYTNEYNQDMGAQQQAQQQFQNYQANMVDPTKLYGNALQSATQAVGYDPRQMQAATSSLNTLNSNLSQANNQFNTAGGVNASGMSAGQLASYEGNILNPLQAGIGAQSQNLAQQNALYQNVLTQAGAQAGSQQAGQQEQLGAYSDAVKQAQATTTLAQQQAAQAMQQMQFYSGLASTQQGLTASEQKAYQDAYNGYQTAQAAMTQAQAVMTLNTATAQNFNLQNAGLQNTLNSQAAKAQAGAQQKSNQEYQTMNTPAQAPKQSPKPTTHLKILH